MCLGYQPQTTSCFIKGCLEGYMGLKSGVGQIGVIVTYLAVLLYEGGAQQIQF